MPIPENTMPEIRELKLVEGRFFTEEEDRRRQFVAVLGDDVRAALFPASSALGRAVQIAGLDFQVIGVIERVGSSFGVGQDNMVYIPSSAFSRMYGSEQSMQVYDRGLDHHY